MADFFDKFKKGLNKATTTVSVKSTSMLEINKLKGEISSLAREKKAICTEIGEKICSMKVAGSIDLSQVDQLIGKTIDIDTKTAELEAQIEEVTRDKDEKLNALDDEVVSEAPVADAVVTAETVETPAEEIVVDQIPVEEIKTEEADTSLGDQSGETGEYKA